MRQGLLQVVYILLGIGMAAKVAAQDYKLDGMVPSFKFQKNGYLLNPGLSSDLTNYSGSEATNYASLPEIKFQSYDAIFYYPLHHQGVSIDLGLNLRLLEDQSAYDHRTGSTGRDWLSINPNETRALVHAAAVFDLPFSGLKAGVSGTYNADLNNAEYDYTAKLSYQWKSGLGLEGGWQHQQKLFEQQNLNDVLGVRTLFLDMNYRF